MFTLYTFFKNGQGVIYYKEIEPDVNHFKALLLV